MLSHSDYVAEPKLDGARFMLYLDADDTGDRAYFYSRRDFPRIDRAANVPHIAKKYSITGIILDGEAIREAATCLGDTSSIMLSLPAEAIRKQQTDGNIVFHAFDILFYKGEDLCRLPLWRRREILAFVVKTLDNPDIRIVPQVTDVPSYFRAVVDNGGEGVVVKNIHNGYGVGWAKWKRRGDVSCVITGFKPGKGKYEGQVGAIEVAAFNQVGKLTPIGFASGMTDAVRHDISTQPDKYIGTVVDIFAQEMTKDFRLRHPVFHRFREDIDPTDCTIAKAVSDLVKS